MLRIEVRTVTLRQDGTYSVPRKPQDNCDLYAVVALKQYLAWDSGGPVYKDITEKRIEYIWNEE
jgi:hypothetical protein